MTLRAFLGVGMPSAGNIDGVRFGVGYGRYVDVRLRMATYVDVLRRTWTYVDVRRRGRAKNIVY